MAHRGGHACFLLQSRSVLGFAAEILAQQLERDETIQERVTHLIHRPHPANAKRPRKIRQRSGLSFQKTGHSFVSIVFWPGNSRAIRARGFSNWSALDSFGLTVQRRGRVILFAAVMKSN